MIAALLTGAVLCNASHPPARESRAAFAHAMAEVKDDMPKRVVKKLLGPPDDVLSAAEAVGLGSPGDDAWCYGTNGHRTMPTLGFVVFRQGKALYEVGGWGEPPSPKVIADNELVRGMREVEAEAAKGPQTCRDSLRLIRTANLLIPKGREKAIAILEEYERLTMDVRRNDLWLFWLVRVLFRSRAPGGTFPIPVIGAITPAPPQGLRQWPTYPVLMTDGVPICLFGEQGPCDFPEPFALHIRDNERDWDLRTSLLRPPDDPFPSLDSFLESPAWPFAKSNPTTSAFYKAQALSRVLELVRAGGMKVEGTDLDSCHRAFLAQHPHWDEKREAYVAGG